MAFASDKGRQGAAGQGGETSYEISKSLRFNDDDSAYLTLPTSWTPNRKTFTMSFWTKRTFHNTRQSIFSLYNGAKEFQIAFDGTDDNKLIVMEYNSGYVWRLTSSASYRDPSAWLHVVISIDTTQPITSNRVKMYVNGQQITDFETEAYPSLNYDNHIGGATGREMVLGMWGYATWSPAGYQRKFDGYLADVHFLDGHAVNPDTFGEFNKYGQWVAKTPTFANPSFDDGSDSNLKVELFGDVQTTVGKYGQGFAFDGSGDYLYAGCSVDVGTSDWTLEYWVNPTSGANTASYSGQADLHHATGQKRIETAIHSGTFQVYTPSANIFIIPLALCKTMCVQVSVGIANPVFLHVPVAV